ncbi:Aste57867_25342 [Aphanomyces stellatus]|uniref:Aste57867_25342 protein n=1 Tax=Aphanomyces stellatus TaxID=120398 RepID=A0A485LVC3_9STRA|nr:hypothetical protein As57867_025264 [Aphanomyces stellatus]VFU01967.1 Aste57867_25342 [Aphanomyces stellatus]
MKTTAAGSGRGSGAAATSKRLVTGACAAPHLHAYIYMHHFCTAGQGHMSTTLVNAAALQDHLVRSLNLNMPAPLRVKKKPSMGKTNVGGGGRGAQKGATAAIEKATMPSPPPNNVSTDEYRKVWVCDSCTLENDDRDDRCLVCDAFKPNNRRVKLTLAQKKGLVQAPPPKLSQNQWEDCEARAAERGDAGGPCSICRESFGMQPKVILNCSHMFHHNCLASFERFLRTSQRVCPLCRKQNYQKRMTTQGERLYRVQCVLKIQTRLRGFLARKRFPVLLGQYYKRGFGSPSRRKAFYATKLGTISDRIVSAIDAREDSIDSLLAEFDKSMLLSRQVFGGDDGGVVDDPRITSKLMTRDKWLDMLTRATARDEKECPICINPIDATKTVTLLSCSHVLHADCLDAFESFNIYEVHLCPVCRSHYESKALQNGPDGSLMFAAS